MALFNLIVAAVLCLFTLWEVNYPVCQQHSSLAFFSMCGLVLCFLNFPMVPRWKDRIWSRALDVALAVVAVAALGYIIVQTEPLFRSLWLDGRSLGNRAGSEVLMDYVAGTVIMVLVLEASRRCMGLALPALTLIFLGYALWGQYLPRWLLTYGGDTLQQTVASSVLQGGAFGQALDVMFKYVFLFVVFGAFLGVTGSTEFIIEFARKIFGKSSGGPAKMAVVSSGLMGSLSGSAVANVVTTGTFTIPLMRASGFRPEVAGGIEAAASSGGALMPPVMGAAAYLMLELVQPQVTYLQVIKSALIPALLYYLSLFLFVHFHSKKHAISAGTDRAGETQKIQHPYQGILFAASLTVLILILVIGYSPMRAVTVSMAVLVVMSFFDKSTRLSWSSLKGAIVQSGRDAVPLVCAAACVGILIGVVDQTGLGQRFTAQVMSVSQDNLIGALVMIMVASIVLGMGLPSVVCYLVMATLVQPVLGKLGVPPLAAHFFIFYFGMMSMVTPPVALAGYAAASIAGSGIMITSWWAFRVALVGFTLPYMFVFRPELLLLAPTGQELSWVGVTYAVIVAIFGVTSFAAGLSGFLFTRLKLGPKLLMYVSAALMLYPAQSIILKHSMVTDHDLAGMILFCVVAVMNWKASRAKVAAPQPS